VRSSRSSHTGAGVVLAALAVVVGAGACGKPKSFIVLDLKATSATEISGVTEVDVDVSQPPSSMLAKLRYPVPSAAGGMLVINDTNINNLSVSFTGGRSGPVTLSVRALDASGCVVGSADDVSVSIRQGDIVAVGVGLEAHSCTTADGGTNDGQPESDAFPGCDPAAPMCAAGETCQVNCTKNAGECTPGGSGGSGAACTTNKDCAPGAQCFDYAGTGCPVRICLRFCNSDDTCQPGGPANSPADGGAGDGGAPSGPRSVCQGLVPCGSTITAYHTCTFACDPRQVAAAARTSGCPTGLSCLVVGTMDQVDCSCAEATRKGMDGDDCTGGADCAPGYICNMMASTKKCRAICRCDKNNTMSCTAKNECGTGKSCAALTNETTFGICL
jgi:hypothetical protein